MRYSTYGTGRAESRAGTPIHLYETHTTVRSSVGSPLAHTKRARDPTDAPRRERAGTQPRSHTNGESGRRAQAAARQTGRQAGRGRQAGGQAKQPRHVTTPTALPSLGSIRSRSGGRVSPTFPSSSTATLCPRCPPLTRSSLLVRSLVLSGAPFRAATLPLPLRRHLIPDLLVVVLLPLPHASADALFRKRARSCLSFSPRFFSFSRILALRPCLLNDPSV